MLKRFYNLTSGNVAVIVALMFLPMVGAAGLAVDFTNKAWEQDAIQKAADAAILAGVGVAKAELDKGKSNKFAARKGRRTANQYFKTNLLEKGVFTDGRFRPKIDLKNGNIAGSGTYRGEMPTSFARVLGFQSLSIDVESHAAITSRQFIEVHFVVDVSASMGVGATQKDIEIMSQNFGCAFSCHLPEGWDSHKYDVTDVRALGARVRIDVVKDALQSTLNVLQKESGGKSLRVAIHTFSNNLHTMLNLTSDMKEARKQVDAIDLTNKFGEGGTSPYRSLNQLASVIGPSGDGESTNSPKKVVVVVTDGTATNRYFSEEKGTVVAEEEFKRTGPQVWLGTGIAWGLHPIVCRELKRDAGATVFTMNVEYITPKINGKYTNAAFEKIEDVLKPRIMTNLQKCASSKDASYAAESPKEIQAALVELASQVRLSALRLVK